MLATERRILLRCLKHLEGGKHGGGVIWLLEEEAAVDGTCWSNNRAGSVDDRHVRMRSSRYVGHVPAVHLPAKLNVREKSINSVALLKHSHRRFARRNLDHFAIRVAQEFDHPKPH